MRGVEGHGHKGGQNVDETPPDTKELTHLTSWSRSLFIRKKKAGNFHFPELSSTDCDIIPEI